MIPQLLNKLEQKAQRANNNKEKYIKQKLNRSVGRSRQIDEAQERFEQIKERRELDIMGQVIVKHHKK